MHFCYADCEAELRKHNQINQAAFFISDWNSSSILRPDEIIQKVMALSVQHSDEYFFPSDNIGQDVIASLHRTQFGINLAEGNIVVAASATELLFVAILEQILNGVKGFLVFSPVYYSIIEAIEAFNISPVLFNLHFPYFMIDWHVVEEVIMSNNIACIVVTDPIWGSGVSISDHDMTNLIQIARRHSCHIIIDHARGGMKWECQNHSVGCKISQHIPIYDNISIIDSPCKRLFLNGVKFAIMYTSSNLKKKYDHLIDILSGSISAPQALLMREIFQPAIQQDIIHKISANIQKAKNCYQLLHTFLLGKNAYINRPDDGYYAMLAFPRNMFSYDDDHNIFLELLHKHHIYTIPMSLSGCDDHLFYLVRVNLLLPPMEILQALGSVPLLDKEV